MKLSKRQAKRDACWKGAAILQNVLDAGWETDTWYPDEDDEQRFLAALAELIAELERRGAR
jgi:hypothetical protein